MKRKLGDIADIHFGLNKQDKEGGEYKYLLSSHFNSSYKPTKLEDSSVKKTEKSESYLLHDNDVILAGKGHRIFAWAYDPSFGPTVPSSLFYIIKTNPEEISGAYLAYYLNSDSVLHKLKLIGAGSSIISIPKRELTQVEVFIPSIDEQQRIISLAKLFEKDIALSKEILEKKKELKRGLINQMITKNLK